MNEYTFEELAVGQEESFTAVITEEMMVRFRDISGDVNPLHTDEAFAKGKGFPGRVAYGMLVASLYSRLAGVHLPGRNCLLQSVQSDFMKPVFIGDELTVTGKIIEKDESVRRLVIKAAIRNQEGKKVSKARIEAGVI